MRSGRCKRFNAGPRTVGIALFGVAAVTVFMQGGLVRVLAPRLGEPRLGSWGALGYTAGLVLVAAAGSSLAVVGAGAGAVWRRCRRVQPERLRTGIETSARR